MQKNIRRFSLILPLIFLLQLSLHAQDDKDNDDNKKEKKYEYEKKKTLTKSYSVSSEKLNIENKFGMVEIHVWNKSEIKVDVEISVSAHTEDWAKSVINDIQVEDSRSGNTIRFKTLFVEDLDKKEGKNGRDKRIKKYENKNTSQNMEVNYAVYMPASNPLVIDNQFGPIILPDYKGEVDLTSKFGKITTGNLSDVKNISVEFGKAMLGNIPGGSLSIKYSSATIARLSGNIKINLEFSTKVFLNIDKDLSGLDLKASYSTVNVRPIGDVPAAYMIATSFGSFKNKTAIKFSSDEDEEDHGPTFDHEYSGKSGSGNIPVKVKSSFSTVILGEASEEEMKGEDPEKDKHKKKTVTI